MSAGKLTLGLILAAAVSCAPRDADEQAPPTTGTQDTAAQAAREWAAAPGLPTGAEMAVLSGNPGEAGPFTVHLRVPNDYRFPPHTHPAAETVTVISGLLHTGLGETFNLSGDIAELRPGQSQEIAANEPHFAHAAGETVIEVRSVGPFRIDYVNPADAPATP
jgi:quercetin dioxygenase-like cupin family protein